MVSAGVKPRVLPGRVNTSRGWNHPCPIAYLVFKILAQIHSSQISIFQVLRRILFDGSKMNGFDL